MADGPMHSESGLTQCISLTLPSRPLVERGPDDEVGTPIRGT